ncbi:23698_t:CDS:2 [Racocetra persica]|uniref:23698_t:CDS:1 n=1 Tax=Racocetra persica TaxID=160502 RepID=A0ACA9MDM9_9GLOM|nr:23698_t:CDS:2 [Racocetra persica]
MDDTEKSLLEESGIDVSIDTANPLFNYPSYLKVFDNLGLDIFVKNWFFHSKSQSKDKNRLIIDVDKRILLSENLVTLVATLPSLCKKLRELNIRLQVMDMHLVNLIQSQTNLQCFKLDCSGNIAPAISALQYQSDSLIRVEFSHVQFIGIALDALASCKNLQTLSFIKFLESAIETANCHLKELFMNSSSPKIIESITKFCPNIKILEIDIKTSSTNQFLILLSKLVQLERLSVNFLIYDTSDFLISLPVVLPTTLFNLKLYFQNTPWNLEYFLKKCRAPIQTLIVFGILGVDDEQVGFITQFAKESKTLKKVIINDRLGRRLVFYKNSEDWTTWPLYLEMQNSRKINHLTKFCQEFGLDFLTFDHYAHGLSTGSFLNDPDGNVTIGRWLNDLCLLMKQETCGPQILVGSSMGAWLALLVLLKRNDLRNRVNGIIGVAPSINFTEKIWKEESRKHYLHKEIIDVKNISCPITFIHGQDDNDVSYHDTLKWARMLSPDENARENVKVVLIPDGDHRLSREQDLKILKDEIAKICFRNNS